MELLNQFFKPARNESTVEKDNPNQERLATDQNGKKLYRVGV